MTVLSFNSSSESSWIESTTPAHAAEDVGRLDPFSVTFARTVAMACLVSGNFNLLTPNGEEVVNAFQPVDLTNDYSDISKTLTLRLNAALDADAEYAFVIEGLYDPSGTPQDQPHIVLFVTNTAAVTLDPVIDDDLIVVENHTLANTPLVLQPVESVAPDAAHIVRTVPTNLSYNLATNYNAGIVSIVFDRAPTDVTVSIERRPISFMEVAWSAVVDGGTANGNQWNVQIPVSAGSDYLAAGYEYRIVVTAATFADTTSFSEPDGIIYYFTGPLSPMFASVKDVFFYMPTIEPFYIAREIYLNSQYVTTLDTSIDPAFPPKAASDYALYATLYKYVSNHAEANSVQLGDFMVEKKNEYSFADRFKKLMDDALSRLTYTGPRVVVKGGNYPSPFADRSWRGSVQ